ncbi:MAG: TraB/GumN family protein, partial [Thermomonas sp.]
MRKTILAMSTLLAMAAMPLQAQVPPATPATPPVQEAPIQQATVGADGIRTEATVIVDGTQPGPGLWLVRKGSHDLWILGTISPLPAKMQWQTRQIEEVIGNAQEVIYQPSMSVSSDIGKFRAMFLLPSMIGIKNNPDGKKLSDVLPAATYVRWSAFRDRFLDRDDDKLRPAFAADALWKAAIKRSGMSDKGIVSPVVAAAVERHQPKVTLVKQTIMVKDPKAALKQFKAAELEDLACLERTLDRLGEDMELLRGRANAWATGDVAALRAMPQTDQYQAC